MAVTFEVKPDFGQTKGSMWTSVLNAAAAGLSQTPYVPTRQTMEFKAEFQELRLYRDGELVVPITLPESHKLIQQLRRDFAEALPR